MSNLGKTFTGDLKLKEPELIVAGTNKERILSDILEFIHNLHSEFDESNFARGEIMVDKTKAISAVTCISKLIIGDSQDMKDLLLSTIETLTVSNDDGDEESNTRMSASDEAVAPNSNIQWCLAESGPLSTSTEEFCNIVLQNRVVSKKFLAKKCDNINDKEDKENIDPNSNRKRQKTKNTTPSSSVPCRATGASLLLGDITNLR